MPSTYKPTPTAVPVWLDCDPGNDDAFAILLAAFHPSFRLLGISTVHGNVALHKTTRNTLALLEAMRFTQDEINVFPGEALPLKVAPLHAEAIHGHYGIGGAELPENPRLVENKDFTYLDAMRDAVRENAGEICIVCTGALTNFANFIKTYPEDVLKIRYVSIMGGAFDCGNIAPNVEFNMRTDPHAAQIVFNERRLANRIALAPLNLTHTALATSRVQKAIYDSDGENNSPLRLMFLQILSFYSDAYVKKYNHTAGPPIHDPLALFLVLPLYAGQHASCAEFADECDFHYLQRNLIVETEGPEMGRILFENKDRDPLRVEKGGVYVGQSVNVPFFWKHVLAALASADEQVFARAE
ncbi:uridine nucleosidase [Metschnikowia aff. pulcherrima]|uniref:Uridine nucleosidase n=1 Tax=Metschnikowia aff. pulcherrima TaxID=2163413 RepID=A0A4P6XU51_9ASCO|nr:uridine nucleosidase [Metschnikowia aff. pulcherrima]